MSDFRSWEGLSHAKDWLIFPENIGERLSLDETALSHGELYTVLTNKSAKGRKGCIVAIAAGTKSEDVMGVFEKISLRQRNKVKEITLDMAGSMNLITKKCFPKATLVTDRSMFRNLPLRHCRKSGSGIGGKPLMQKMRSLMKPGKTRKHSNRKFFPMAILKSNCWQEAGTCSIRTRQNGLPIKTKGQKYFLSSILICKGLIILLSSSREYLKTQPKKYLDIPGLPNGMRKSDRLDLNHSTRSQGP